MAILADITVPRDVDTEIDARAFSLTLNTRGLKYYVKGDGEEKVKQIQVGDAVLLQREPDNEFDANAIRVCFPSPKETIGHVGREQAKILASYLDNSWLEILSVKVVKKETTTLQLCAKLSTFLSRQKKHDLERNLGNDIDVNALLSKDLAAIDLEASQNSPFKLEDLKTTQSPPWRPAPEFASSTTRGTTMDGGLEIEMDWLVNADGTFSN
jgi:hypothetical protein